MSVMGPRCPCSRRDTATWQPACPAPTTTTDSPRMSVVAQPAADVERLRGDRGRGVRGQVRHETGDLFRRAVPTQRDLGVELLEDLFLGDTPVVRVTLADAAGHGRLDVAGAHRVDGDAGLRELDADGLAEPDDAVLGRRVGRGEHDALLAAGGGDVDDPAPGLL